MPDTLNFIAISLVPNDFAIDTNSLTFDEALNRCRYYYQKSFPIGTLPVSGSPFGACIGVISTPPPNLCVGPIVRFDTPMRGVPIITLYSAGTTGAEIYSVGGTPGAWTSSGVSTFSSIGFYTSGVPNAGAVNGEACAVQFTANAQLGI